MIWCFFSFFFAADFINKQMNYYVTRCRRFLLNGVSNSLFHLLISKRWREKNTTQIRFQWRPMRKQTFVTYHFAEFYAKILLLVVEIIEVLHKKIGISFASK